MLIRLENNLGSRFVKIKTNKNSIKFHFMSSYIFCRIIGGQNDHVVSPQFVCVNCKYDVWSFLDGCLNEDVIFKTIFDTP